MQVSRGHVLHFQNCFSFCQHRHSLRCASSLEPIVLKASRRAEKQGFEEEDSRLFQAWLDKRDWEAVASYYKRLVQGTTNLSGLSSAFHQSVPNVSEAPVASNGRTNVRYTYKVTCAYFGPAFQGWASQPGLLTLEGMLSSALQPLMPAGTTSKVSVSVAGRTDKGVSAAAQVCSFYSWALISKEMIVQAVEGAAPDFRVVRVENVPRSFHPTFAARWRRYVYLFPLEVILPESSRTKGAWLSSNDGQEQPCMDVDVNLVNTMLQGLEGRPLDYSSFARDTPKGKSGVCTLLLARALTVSIPNTPPLLSRPECTVLHNNDNRSQAATHDPDPDTPAMMQQQPQEQQPRQHCTSVQVLCIELIGDRFLRRMVRVLVATAVREASAQQGMLPPINGSRNSSSTNGNGGAALDSQGSSNGTVTAALEESKNQADLFPGSVSLPESLRNGGSSVRVMDSDPVSAVMDSDPPSAVTDLDPSSALRRFCGGLDMRLLTAPAAPALGLCFAGVGYNDSDDVVLLRRAAG